MGVSGGKKGRLATALRTTLRGSYTATLQHGVEGVRRGRKRRRNDKGGAYFKSRVDCLLRRGEMGGGESEARRKRGQEVKAWRWRGRRQWRCRKKNQGGAGLENRRGSGNGGERGKK